MNLDAPFDRLSALPRTLWLPGLVTAVGEPAQRLDDTRAWLSALLRAELPPPACDWGDAAAVAPVRLAVGELGLPRFCRGWPDMAEQVLRTLLWHLDRIVDLQPRCTRSEAIAQVAGEFRAAWEEHTEGLEAELALLQGLGDCAHLRWDSLRGQLRSRPWLTARRAAERLAQMPALVALIEALGRAERHPAAPPAWEAEQAASCPRPLRAVRTTIPHAPGAVTGVCFSNRLDRMLPAEAMLLRHPVGARLWRARQAEARLLSWQTEAPLSDWRPDPQAAVTGPAQDRQAAPLARGPILLCLDTSGSMRGAPENIAKAVALAVLRTARAAGRGCRLIAFGGPGELISHDLGDGPDGFQALLDLMGQAFDGGTDLQSPIEHAVAAVHSARWRSADLLIVSDGEFGCTPATLQSLDDARNQLGLRVQGVLVGDRETLGLLETCDAIHWVRDWRRHADAPTGAHAQGYSPVHRQNLTALYFPNALSSRAARHAPADAASSPSPTAGLMRPT
jgi:uncharacterized protein with von Willebrand factor type A (vWA) domain